MSSRHAKQKEELDFRILRLLPVNHEASQWVLAHQPVLSMEINYCLDALIDEDLIELGSFHNNQQKFKCIYLCAQVGYVEKTKLTSRLLQGNVAQYERLKAEIDALRTEAADSAGHCLSKVGR